MTRNYGHSMGARERERYIIYIYTHIYLGNSHELTHETYVWHTNRGWIITCGTNGINAPQFLVFAWVALAVLDVRPQLLCKVDDIQHDIPYVHV
jgi:hypothetical protein